MGKSRGKGSQDCCGGLTQADHKQAFKHQTGLMEITGYLGRGESAGGGRSVCLGKKNFAELSKSLKEKETRAAQYWRQASTAQQSISKTSNGPGLSCTLESFQHLDQVLSPFTSWEGGNISSSSASSLFTPVSAHCPHGTGW